MLPISLPFLAPATSAPPGAAPVPASGGSVFASLLPPRVTPVMPRQGDAEGGKDLPASAGRGDVPANDAAAPWIAPPPWRVIGAPDAVDASVSTVSASLADPAPIVDSLTSDVATPGADPRIGELPAALLADVNVTSPHTAPRDGQPNAAAGTGDGAAIPPRAVATMIISPDVASHAAAPATGAGAPSPGVGPRADAAITPLPDARATAPRPDTASASLTGRAATSDALRAEGSVPAPAALATSAIASLSALRQPVAASATPIPIAADGAHAAEVAAPSVPLKTAASDAARAGRRGVAPSVPAIGAAALSNVRPFAETLPIRLNIAGPPTVATLAAGSTLPAHVAANPLEAAAFASQTGGDTASPTTLAEIMLDRAPRGAKDVATSPELGGDIVPDSAPRRGRDGTTSSISVTAPGTAQPRPQAMIEALPPQPLRIAPAPAAQVFAAAIQQVMQDERHGDRPDPALTGIAPAAGVAPHAVAAVDGARQGALDMARDTWPAKMIERIEMLRDAMNAVDTSIRLMPDKLGAIDVSIRKDGDAVAVHFNAQQAETRQLLVDAQPRLAEMAEARGLRLSTQTGDGGQQHQAQQQQQQQQANAAASPRFAPHDAPYPAPSPADERVA